MLSENCHLLRNQGPYFNSYHFKEFTVNFDDTGKTAADINKALLDHKIFGGKDLSKDFPEPDKALCSALRRFTAKRHR